MQSPKHAESRPSALALDYKQQGVMELAYRFGTTLTDENPQTMNEALGSRPEKQALAQDAWDVLHSLAGAKNKERTVAFRNWEEQLCAEAGMISSGTGGSLDRICDILWKIISAKAPQSIARADYQLRSAQEGMADPASQEKAWVTLTVLADALTALTAKMSALPRGTPAPWILPIREGVQAALKATAPVRGGTAYEKAPIEL